MKRSNFFIPMKKDSKADSNCKSCIYMEKLGMVHNVGAGMYTHLPLSFKIFQNVKDILNKHLLDAGCSLHQFSAIQPVNLWKDSGRFEIFGDSIFTLQDKHKKDICLAPTHEVMAAYTGKSFIKSYKDMPIRISQIQTKFRDETRPRAGLIRTREFTMHDLYSFDVDMEQADIGYELIKQAYVETFIEFRIPFVLKEQTDMGEIGGVKSHEFHALVEIGEDECEDFNGKTFNSLELAHIFMLGDKYTKPIDAMYVDKENNKKPIFMCSFGMGIERTVSSFIENYYKSDKDLQWSWALSPFKVMILGNNEDSKDLYFNLKEKNYEPIIDDRETLSFGKKLKEGFMLGLPIYIIYGKKFENEDLVEVKVPLLNKTVYLTSDKIEENIKVFEDDIKAIEIVKMSFNEYEVDYEKNTIFVKINNVTDLENNFCKKIIAPSDKLGNFGNKQVDKYQLKSGKFWIIPILLESIDNIEVDEYKDIPYIKVKVFKDLDFDRMKAEYSSYWN